MSKAAADSLDTRREPLVHSAGCVPGYPEFASGSKCEPVTRNVIAELALSC